MRFRHPYESQPEGYSARILGTRAHEPPLRRRTVRPLRERFGPESVGEDPLQTRNRSYRLMGAEPRD
jgi:hypothetical protein